MNESQMWSRTILTAYRSLPRFASCIEKCTTEAAMSGFSYTGDAMQLYRKILRFNQRKEGLINLKVIVEKALGDLKPKMVEILRLKYFKQMSFAAIAQSCGVCIRTVFRRYAAAIEGFTEVLQRRGYNANWFEERYRSEPFIAGLYDKIFEQSLTKRTEEDAERFIGENGEYQKDKRLERLCREVSRPRRTEEDCPPAA